MQTGGLRFGVSHGKRFNRFGLNTRQQRSPAQNALFSAVLAVEFVEIFDKGLALGRSKGRSLPGLARDGILGRRLAHYRVARIKTEAILADIGFVVQSATINRVGHGGKNGTVGTRTRGNPGCDAGGARCHCAHRAGVARIDDHNRNAFFTSLRHDERQVRRRGLRIGAPDDDEL